MSMPQMTAMQWNDIQHITEFDRLSADDYQCLEDIRRVLTHHQRLNKFGVALLHHHFPLHDDEVFVESVDPVTRTMSLRATPRGEVDVADMQETLWRFGPLPGDIRAMTECRPSLTHDQSEPTRPRPSPSPSPGSVDPTDPTTPPVKPDPPVPPSPQRR